MRRFRKPIAIQRKSFEEGYRRFTKGHFTVEPTGERLKPPPGGGEAVLGVLRDTVASPKDVNNKFETLSHDCRRSSRS